jgi:hypothetical protein
LSGEKIEIYFADATSLKVCRNKRINRRKVFKGFASRGKINDGMIFWF